MMRCFLVLMWLLATSVACGDRTATYPEDVDSSADPTAIVPEVVSFPSFELIGEIDHIFQHPESIVYDGATQMLYVSNLGLDTGTIEDRDGYISKLNIHGEIIDARWVEGLSNPRGMCIVGGVLYVADMDKIAKVDLESGEVIASVSTPGLKMLSDLAVGANGKIYATDQQANRIYELAADELQLWNENLNWFGPSGLYSHGGKLLLTSAEGNRLMAVDLHKKETYQIADSLHQARGITMIGADMLVGGMSGQLYGVKPTIDFRWPLIDLEMQRDNVAGILYVEEFDVLFVPTYSGHSVLAIAVMQP